MAEPNRIPRKLPVINVNNIVIFPYLMIPLVVSDEKLKKVIDYALANDKLLGFFLHQGENEEDETEIYDFGTAVSIVRMLRNQDGSISLLLQGVSRIKMEKITQENPFMMVEVVSFPEKDEQNLQVEALKKISLELVEKIINEGAELTKELLYGLKNIKQSSRVADIIAGNLSIRAEQKQELLETQNLIERFEKLNKFMAESIKQMRIENRIRNKIQLEMDEDQRKFYLREQLDAIKKELGESNEIDQEKNKWEKKILEAKLPDYVEDVAKEELERLSFMSPASSEYSVIRNYLDWLVSIPWNNYSEDRLDIKKIEQILANDHYGLSKPKERILEYIAVKKLKKKLKGPILCFVGPPGTGKTSLGKSVARALNRKFIRFSLGGIHDEAEIRGHRRTYIGAMPGKIISEIKRAGTANPLIMLDEIDKVGKDFRGDPASALLEVLDPEQNNTFLDNYLNVHFDLSDVMFITTANRLDTIRPALRDRMEIVEFSSYIEEEKIHIARKYLIPKEAENNGLTGKNIKFMKSSLQELNRYYVRETGVRNLQRTIASVMRKVAKKVAEGENKQFIITDKSINDMLGKRKYSLELANRKAEVGIVTGMAWTSFGGEILFCETSLLPGKGQFILTGRLGEVMKESARIAYSFIKSNHKHFEIDLKKMRESDIHIHFPAGAVPKDGPSAGVTLTTSLISALTGRKVKHNVAMTGEITLTGRIMKIGGVREKILAAKRAGIKKILLPFENQDSFYDIDEDIRDGMNVIFVNKIDDILEEVLI